MDQNFSIHRTKPHDGELVQVGPADSATGLVLRVPSSMQRLIRYRQLNLEVLLDCVFSGDRIEVVRLTIEGQGRFIATKDLTQLSLPLVIRDLAVEVIPGGETWLHASTKPGTNSPRTQEFIAQLYWFEHLSWGSPRNALMNYMGWSRTNSNWHIKKLAKQFRLPGAHAKQQ